MKKILFLALLSLGCSDGGLFSEIEKVNQTTVEKQKEETISSFLSRTKKDTDQPIYEHRLETYEPNTRGLFSFRNKNEVDRNKRYRSVKGLSYGTYDSNHADQLMLDLYIPEDDQKAKPLVVLFHGGGYIYGSKENSIIVQYAKDLARAGFVTASVNYRYLDFSSLKSLAKLAMHNEAHVKKTIYNSLRDARAALAFLASRSSEFEVDPNNIFIGGFSAGAIIALNTTLLSDKEAQSFFGAQYQGGLDDLANGRLHHDYRIKGIISLAGAMFRGSDLDDSDPPMLLMHGTNDLILSPWKRRPFEKFIKDYELTLPGLSYELGAVTQRDQQVEEITLFGITIKLQIPEDMIRAFGALFTFPLSGSDEIYTTIKKSPYAKKCTYLQFKDAPHCFMRADEHGGFDAKYERSLKEIFDFLKYYSNTKI